MPLFWETRAVDHMTNTLPTYPLAIMSLTVTCVFNSFLLATHPQTAPGLPAQSERHAESFKDTLLARKERRCQTRRKRKSWQPWSCSATLRGGLAPAEPVSFPSQLGLVIRAGATHARRVLGGWQMETGPCSSSPTSRPSEASYFHLERRGCSTCVCSYAL